MKPIIEVNDICKKYRYGELKPYSTLRDTLTSVSKNPLNVFRNRANGTKLAKDEFWSLKDISFNVNQGEILGIIGPNGSGKSTLLKILSRITPPTKGEAILRGRVGSLLEVGTGFHQELTGRENIYLNGAILGMRKKEIKSKFDEIVDFSGVEKFLDTPVKHYSSGMYVRLAFAVAAHLEPEILLIDEVLAVGDTEFQKKCLGKMNDVSQSGKTILFVSHNMSAVRSLCGRSILMRNGRIESIGDTDLVIKKYLLDNQKAVRAILYPTKNVEAQISEIHFEHSMPHNSFNFRDPIKLEIDMRVTSGKTRFYLGFSVVNQYGEVIVFWRDIELLPDLKNARAKGKYVYKLEIPGMSLSPGEYHVELALVEMGSSRLIYKPNANIFFNVVDLDSERSKIGLPWRGITSIPITMAVEKGKNK